VPPVHPLLLDYDADRLAAAARDADLRLVLLFGSRATGQADEESDLDVAVLAGHRRVDVGALYEALGPAFPGHELDVALLNDADPLFRYEVMRAARLLYGDPDLFAEQQAFAYRAFSDSADLRALEGALSRKKLDRLLRAAT